MRPQIDKELDELLKWWCNSDIPSVLKLKEVNDNELPFIAGDKVGRNDPCYCGSGKKFKKCCKG